MVFSHKLENLNKNSVLKGLFFITSYFSFLRNSQRNSKNPKDDLLEYSYKGNNETSTGSAAFDLPIVNQSDKSFNQGIHCYHLFNRQIVFNGKQWWSSSVDCGSLFRVMNFRARSKINEKAASVQIWPHKKSDINFNVAYYFPHSSVRTHFLSLSDISRIHSTGI